MIVDLTILKAMNEYFSALNKADLKEITWKHNGLVIQPTEKEIEQWKFTGLNNRDFAIFVLYDKIPKDKDEDE